MATGTTILELWHTDGQNCLKFVHEGIFKESVAADSDFFLQSKGNGNIVLNWNSGDVGIGTNNPDQKLSVNGNASKSGGGTWVAFSDKRLKTDIQPYQKGLRELLQINPVRFRYNKKSGYKDTNKHYVGVIAQDIEKVLPTTVSKFDDSDGPSGLSDKRVFDSSELMWTLINTVKELKSENDILKKRLLRLEQALKK